MRLLKASLAASEEEALGPQMRCLVGLRRPHGLQFQEAAAQGIREGVEEPIIGNGPRPSCCTACTLR